MSGVFGSGAQSGGGAMMEAGARPGIISGVYYYGNYANTFFGESAYPTLGFVVTFEECYDIEAKDGRPAYTKHKNLSVEMKYSKGDKSKLRKLLTAIYNRNPTDDEMNRPDKAFGQLVLANIELTEKGRLQISSFAYMANLQVSVDPNNMSFPPGCYNVLEFGPQTVDMYKHIPLAGFERQTMCLAEEFTLDHFNLLDQESKDRVLRSKEVAAKFGLPQFVKQKDGSFAQEGGSTGGGFDGHRVASGFGGAQRTGGGFGGQAQQPAQQQGGFGGQAQQPAQQNAGGFGGGQQASGGSVDFDDDIPF